MGGVGAARIRPYMGGVRATRIRPFMGGAGPALKVWLQLIIFVKSNFLIQAHIIIIDIMNFV